VEKVFGESGQPDPPYLKSEDPAGLEKFFMHLAITISYPDIYTVDWRPYLS